MEEINDIPQTIRDQIGSGRVIATIDSINERADIARLDVIPQLVYDVLSKDVPAKDFVSHCSKQLNFGEKKLKAVVREIKEKILKQFDYALLNYGVDIKEIDVSDAITLDEWVKKHNEMLASVGIEVEKPVSTISLENFSDTMPENFGPVKINVSGVADEIPKKIEVTDEPAPLVIHREKPQFGQGGQSSAGGGSGSSQQTKGFSLPFGFFKQKIVSTQTPPTPVRATIEFLKNDKPKRAVDYSELRTPLTPFAKKDEFIREEQKIQNTPPKTDLQPVVQKINPLARFSGNETTPAPKIPEQTLRNTSGEMKNTYPAVKATGGVLDIRGMKIDQNSNFSTNGGKFQISNKAQEEKIVAETSRPMIIDVSKNIEKPATTITAPKPIQNLSAQGATPAVGQGPASGWQSPISPKPFPIQEVKKPVAQEIRPQAEKVPVLSWQGATMATGAPKQTVPTEQKINNPPASGKGFVWFKKPVQKTTPTTDNNVAEKSGPKVEGNTVDLSS